MKYVLLTCLFFSGLFVFGQKKSRALFSSYSVKVKMLDINKEPIINKMFVVNNDSIYSDSSGIIDFKRGYAVVSHLSLKNNKILNGLYIYVRMNNYEGFIRNKWNKYNQSDKEYNTSLIWAISR